MATYYAGNVNAMKNSTTGTAFVFFEKEGWSRNTIEQILELSCRFDPRMLLSGGQLGRCVMHDARGVTLLLFSHQFIAMLYNSPWSQDRPQL